MDNKLRQVPLASFNYRHEAEFAAGFLRDAGIPFRLQIEDPTLGLSAVNSATIWVTAADQRRARQVLDHEITPLDDGDESWADAEGWDVSGDDGDESGDPGVVHRARGDRPDFDRASGDAAVRSDRPGSALERKHKQQSDLTLRQRALAAAGCVGASSTLALDAIRETAWSGWLVGLVAFALAAAALLGRAPGPVKGILEALSGDAP